MLPLLDVTKNLQFSKKDVSLNTIKSIYLAQLGMVLKAYLEKLKQEENKNENVVKNTELNKLKEKSQAQNFKTNKKPSNNDDEYILL